MLENYLGQIKKIKVNLVGDMEPLKYVEQLSDKNHSGFNIQMGVEQRKSIAIGLTERTGRIKVSNNQA